MIRDVGSTDNSVAIIKKFALDRPGRVLIISGLSIRKGVAASYDCLLAKSDAQYVAYWLGTANG